MSEKPQVLAAKVRVPCACKKSFVAAIDDYANFARCPHCDNVVWIDASAKVHEMDPVEYPDKDMIVQGEVEAPEEEHEAATVLRDRVLDAAIAYLARGHLAQRENEPGEVRDLREAVSAFFAAKVAAAWAARTSDPVSDIQAAVRPTSISTGPLVVGPAQAENMARAEKVLRGASGPRCAICDRRVDRLEFTNNYEHPGPPHTFVIESKSVAVTCHGQTFRLKLPPSARLPDVFFAPLADAAAERAFLATAREMTREGDVIAAQDMDGNVRVIRHLSREEAERALVEGRTS